MGAVRAVLPWVVVGVLVVAGGVFGLRSWIGTEPASDDAAAPGVVSGTSTPSPSTPASPTVTASPSSTPTPSATPTPTPTRTTATPSPTPRRTAAPEPRSTRSTGAVVARIKSSLDAKGEPTSIWCPPTVPAAVGTTFGCTVAFASDPATVIADATVRITSADGRFTWRSTPRA
jgi:hypothetical protein